MFRIEATPKVNCTEAESSHHVSLKIQVPVYRLTTQKGMCSVAMEMSVSTDIKLLKTSFTVVCVFVMTWGPVSAVVIVESAGCHIPREVFTTVIYLMFSSSLVNPIIYGIMNPQFKAAFQRVLSCGRYDNRCLNQSCTEERTRETNDAVREVEGLSNSVQDNSIKASSVEDVV